MRSKLTKTIFIIVFVVFLGIIKTERADAFYAYCHYKADDGSSRALMYISDGFEDAFVTYISSEISYSGLAVKNWDSSGTTDATYAALDDAWDNDHCPQYLIYATNRGRGRVYLSDSANIDVYKSVLSAQYHEVNVLTIDSHTFPNKKNDYGAYIQSRVCDCENGSSYTIAKDGSLTAPKVGVNTPQNWSDIGEYAAIDAIKSNDCLDLVKVSRNIYLSDSAIDGGEIYACETSEVVEVVKVKPEYKPVTVNTGIVGTLAPNDDTRSCGNGYITHIPTSILRLVRVFYILIQIFVPIALVILGIVDLMKAITADKEDKIKEGQQIFVKRLIAAVVIFFVFIFVKLVISVFSNDDNEIISCMNCFLDGTDSCDR